MSHGTRSSILLLSLAALIAACGGGDADGDVSAIDAAAGDPASGAAVYAANCAACHGPELRGTASGPPLLDEVYEPSHHGDPAFVLAIRQGVQPHHWDFGAMPPLRDVSDGEIADVIAYVRQQQEAAGIE